MKKAFVYLLVGKENFLKDEFIKESKNKFLDESSKELNFTSLSAKDSKIEDILSIARTPPFLGKKRIVVVSDIENLTAEAKDAFLSFVKNPTETTCLILKSTKSLFGNKFLGSLSRYTTLIKADTISDTAVQRWISDRVASLKKRITKDAVDLLGELVGADLQLLSREIEKIVSFIGPKGEITVEDVQNVVGKSITEDVFTLIDYIAQKDTSKALLLCKRLLQQGKKAHEIIGLIGWQLRKVLSAQLALQKGQKKEVVLRQLGLRRFYLNRFNRLLDNSKTDELKEKLKLLFAADRDIKTSSSKTEFVLDVLISKLCAT